MMQDTETRTATAFERDVIKGLSKEQKAISSRYFYDENGDKLFQQIMRLDEYYLPKAELNILQNQSSKLINEVSSNKVDVVELGAGDGTKTVHFLKELESTDKDIRYIPLDISADVLKFNQKHISAQLPDLNIKPIPGDYFETLHSLSSDRSKILMFMGSNIGNFSYSEAVDFLKLVRANMGPKDVLLVGIDLKKNPKKILRAYNDSQGVTKAFNINLLHRINRELDGNFEASQFDHYPMYDPISGLCLSFLVSLQDQDVMVREQLFHFKKNELLHTEISKKYSLDEVDNLSKDANFSSVRHFLDDGGNFTISLFSY